MNGGAPEADGVLRVALWAAPRAPMDVAARLDLVRDACARAAAAGAGLLVTPEFGLAGAAQDAGTLARPVVCDGPEMQELAAICRGHGIGIVGGYAEACSGRIYSAALVADTEGHATGNYRRVHVEMRQRKELAPGQWLSIIPFGRSRLGLLVGRDLHFPETARGLVLAGADLLVVLGAPDEVADIGLLVQARALENHVAVVYAGYADQSPARCMAAMADGRPSGGETVRDLTIVPLPADEAGQLERRSTLLQGRRPRLYQRVALD